MDNLVIFGGILSFVLLIALPVWDRMSLAKK